MALNKQDIVKGIVKLSAKYAIDPKEFIVGSKGAMVLIGLAESTNDIDVSCTREVFDHFISLGCPTHIFVGAGGVSVLVIEVTPQVDLHVQDREVGIMVTEGVWHEDMHAVLAFKQGLNRPKDQQDIAKLRRHLGV